MCVSVCVARVAHNHTIEEGQSKVAQNVCAYMYCMPKMCILVCMVYEVILLECVPALFMSDVLCDVCTTKVTSKMCRGGPLQRVSQTSGKIKGLRRRHKMLHTLIGWKDEVNLLPCYHVEYYSTTLFTFCWLWLP